MEILVTGGAGFIGSHVVEALLAGGHGVSVLDDFNDFYSPKLKHANLAAVRDRIEIHALDLRQAEAVARIVEPGRFDTIIHLAARAGVRPSIEDPRLYVDTNITGTLNILEAARLGKVQRFIFASSSSVYGLCQTVPFREDLPLSETISPYAATKLPSTASARSACDSLMPTARGCGPISPSIFLPAASCGASRSINSATARCAAITPISTTRCRACSAH